MISSQMYDMFFRWMVFPYFSFMPFSKRECCTCLCKHQLVPYNVFWSFKRHSFKIPSPKKKHDFLHPFIPQEALKAATKAVSTAKVAISMSLGEKITVEIFWNRWVFRVFCTKIRGFCRGDSWKWSASLQRIRRCGWKKSSWGNWGLTTGLFLVCWIK